MAMAFLFVIESVYTQNFLFIHGNAPPFRAQKYLIGGGSKMADFAIVFAQLYIDQVNQGPHAFLVQLREGEDRKPCDGVTIADCGHKLGLNVCSLHSLSALSCIPYLIFFSFSLFFEKKWHKLYLFIRVCLIHSCISILYPNVKC